MAGAVPILTYLPIDAFGTSDTRNIPRLDIMRGDITPAIFEQVTEGTTTFNRIVNTPTPFYIICHAKIFNGYPQISSSLNGINSPFQQAYQQFGLSQGNSTYFPGSNANKSNAQFKTQFFLNTFVDTFLLQNGVDSTGLLVPVYCSKDPFGRGYFFFRADVFWNGIGDASLQLPELPLSYDSPLFPKPKGKDLSQIYNLSAFYTNGTNDNNRVGTWSLFLTNQEIINYVTRFKNFTTGPTAARVLIQFNAPQQSSYNVQTLSPSTVYTVNIMNQESNSPLQKGGFGNEFFNTTIGEYATKVNPAAGQNNLGYPLNFLYPIGGNTYTSVKEINPQVFYQPNRNQYLGNVNQTASDGWNPSIISRLFQGNEGNSFKFGTAYTQGNSTTFTNYTCYCEGGGQYNGLCHTKGRGMDTGINTNGPLAKYNNYYEVACNSIHAGTYQFLTYQFVPLNFYNAPPRTLVPQILDTQTSNITFPNNPNPDVKNPWPTSGLPPNTITNITIAETLFSWTKAPETYFCNELVNSKEYCGFSDYYMSLLGVFYQKGICGESYDTPNVNAPSQIDGTGQFYAFSNSCFNGTQRGICVPNFQYLENPTAIGTKLVIAGGEPIIINLTTVEMNNPDDVITSGLSYNTTTTSVWILINLVTTNTDVFNIGITSDFTTSFTSNIITPFGDNTKKFTFASNQLLTIRYLNTGVASIFLDGVLKFQKSYTRNINQNLVFLYTSGVSKNNYIFSNLIYDVNDYVGKGANPFVCWTPPNNVEPAGTINGFEKIQLLLAPNLSVPVIKDVITWQNLTNYINTYPISGIQNPTPQVKFTQAPAPPTNVIGVSNGLPYNQGYSSKSTGTSTTSSSSLGLIIGIVLGLILLAVIIFFVVRSRKNKKKETNFNSYEYLAINS